MKSFDTDLRKYTDKVRLKASERDMLRERVMSYMEYHPLPKEVGATAAIPSAFSGESFAVLRFSRRTAQFAVGLFALTIVVLPLAAERAVPGEVLYLVKTGINESVRGQFAESPYEKIEFETQLVERRISEARALMNEGKLTDEVQNQLTETVKAHTQNVTDQIAVLRAQDADAAAIAQISFNSSLEVQTAVLHADGGEDVSSPIGAMLTTVTEARDASLTQQEEPAPSYEALLARVEREAARAHELSRTIKQSATAEEIQSIDRRLSDIDRLVLEVKTAHDAAATSTDTETAFAPLSASLSEKPNVSDKLVSTLRLTQKLIAFMTDIDVRSTVTLDALVPVVLSDEERLVNAQSILATSTERITHLSEQLAGIADTTVVAKVSSGLDESAVLSDRIESALVAADLNTAEATIAELTALLSDLEALVKDSTQADAPDPQATEEEPAVEEVASSTSVESAPSTTGSTRPSTSGINASLRSMLRF